jgi:hypothetical protein
MNKCSITNTLLPLYTILSYRDKDEKRNKTDDNSVPPATNNCLKKTYKIIALRKM